MSKFLKQKNSLLNLDGLVEISIKGRDHDIEDPWRIRIKMNTDKFPSTLHEFETKYQCRKVYKMLCQFILDSDKPNGTIDLDKLIEETEEYGN